MERGLDEPTLVSAVGAWGVRLAIRIGGDQSQWPAPAPCAASPPRDAMTTSHFSFPPPGWQKRVWQGRLRDVANRGNRRPDHARSELRAQRLPCTRDDALPPGRLGARPAGGASHCCGRRAHEVGNEVASAASTTCWQRLAGSPPPPCWPLAAAAKSCLRGAFRSS